MLQHLMKLFKNTAYYSIGNISEKAIVFFLIPVYTAFLTPEDYGIVAMMTLIVTGLSIFYISGQHGAAVRFYFEYKTEEKQREYFGTILLYLALLPLCISAILIFYGELIFNIIFHKIFFYPYGLLAVLTAYFAAVPTLRLSLWMAEGKPKKYVFFSFSRLILTVVLILLFIAGFKWGAYGQLLGSAVASGIFWLIAVFLMVRYVNFHVSWKNLKHSLSFGVPLIPHLLAATILSMSDRYMLGYFTDLTQVGLYSLGYTLGSITLVLAASFDKSWSPLFFSLVETDEAEKLFPRVATYFFTIILFITLILSIFSKEIVIVMATPTFQQAYKIIPIVALGIMFNCLYFFPIKTFFYYKKTKLIPLFTGAAAIINILLNLWLIPLYGMTGAAWATVAGYVIMFALATVFSQKMFYIAYEVKRLIIVVTIFSSVFLVDYLIFQKIINDVGLLHTILIKLGIVLATLPVMYIVGCFKKEEINKAKSFL